jgi:hypothetical protein
LVADSNEKQELIWLAAAVANSTFVETFYDRRFNNKLYAGRRRFITQYVEHFPLPNPSTPASARIVQLAKSAYHAAGGPQFTTLEEDLDEMVWEVFGLTSEKV